MNISINEVKTAKKGITITGIDIESVFMMDNMNEDVELFEARFFFSSDDMYAQKYLWKVMMSQKACIAQNTLAGKIKALEGCCVYLSDNFRIK